MVCLLSMQQKTGILLMADDQPCLLPQTSFTLKWRHSVEKSLWQENYVLQDDVFVLTHTYVQAFGAGVPASGQVIAAPDGYIGLKVDVTLPQINWVVSRNMQGEILFDNQVLPINQLVPDYTTVHLAPIKKNWIAWFFQKECL